MQQYYVDYTVNSKTVVFNKEQQHHLCRVLRVKENDQVYVVDESNTKYLVSLHLEDTVYGEILESVPLQSELPVRTYIAQGLIKGDRWDYFIQKSVEFGASDIIPLQMKRNVVKVEKDNEKKLQRWSKIALEAAEQSKRDIRPQVHPVMNLKELVQLPCDLKLIAYEKETDSVELSTLLKGEYSSVLLVVGPEGGFDPQEVEYLVENGFKCVGLGRRILRAESASLYFLSALSYEKELKG
ncbi:MAG: 16S rRNA (uracil(1498)-N(3))-methyltransferase [Erysipelotrichaceae bacterium]|nr:16S rRNA (uracil(1498)-N(3))-methyltransferase [Erysipelotrichaceae bacterium]